MFGTPLRRVIALVVAAAVPIVALASVARQAPAPTSTLPASLSDAAFWQLSEDLSEPNGFFRSENLVSNEHTYEYVIPALEQAVRPGGVYLGVAPDQNFTYMIAVKPAMAFIVDVRRGNLLEHLMYKAVFELSGDRAEFVSRLFSKPRPPDLGAASSVSEIFSAYAQMQTSEALYQQNLRAIESHLTERHHFALSPDDRQQLESIYFSFYWEGPGLRYSSSPGGFGGGGGGRFGRGRAGFPTYEDLMVQTDWTGQMRSYLVSEENYRFIRDLERRNLIVPVVGNFAGPKAVRAVGRYVREHDATVAAFYVSNVEQYLFQDGIFGDWARNVASLPVDDRSTFIRSVSARFGYRGGMTWADGRASALDPIRGFVRAFEAGLIRTYADVNSRSK